MKMIMQNQFLTNYRFYTKSVLTELHNNNMLYNYKLFFDLRQHVSLSVWWQLGYC